MVARKRQYVVTISLSLNLNKSYRQKTSIHNMTDKSSKTVAHLGSVSASVKFPSRPNSEIFIVPRKKATDSAFSTLLSQGTLSFP